MQALVKIGSSQYLVSPGEELLVTRQPTASGSVSFDQVLLLIDGETVKVGQPHLKGVSVKADILEEVKGEKVRVFKYKAKSRYSKTKGFRAKLSKIKIREISK